MEDMRRRQRDPDWKWLLGNVYDCVEFLTVCWTFLMLTVFPLYVIDGYHDIGGYKFSFFSGISALFLVPGTGLAVLWKAGTLVERRDTGQETRKRAGAAGKKEPGISCLDICISLYMAACLVSYLLSGHKEDAWAGVGGWNMGLHTQLLMGAAYYLVSRFFPWEGSGGTGRENKSPCDDGKKEPGKLPETVLPEEKGGAGHRRMTMIVIGGALAGSGLTFLLGILHRFGIDPLGMYVGIDSSYQIRFLSTIGQATWYSSYVCTVFPIGLCLFYASRGKRVRLWSGLYCVLGFMTLVTQNSDSAFAGLGALFFGMFLVSCRSPQRMERFLECVILCAASFKAVGLLQWGSAHRAMELGRLSMALSRGGVSWLLLLVGSGAYVLLLLAEEKGLEESGTWEKTGRRLRKGAAVMAVGGMAIVVALIGLNTSGMLERRTGIFIQSQYLLFNDQWGSDRGFIWRTAVEIFRNMPLGRKLFGAGPDCFMAYSYGIPEYAQKLNEHWKPDVLTNAHNEFLNLLICVGVAGTSAWIAMLASGVKRFDRGGTERPFILTGLFTICSYAAHNFFCYQQVCCTPFLFLILGLSEGLVRKGPACGGCGSAGRLQIAGRSWGKGGGRPGKRDIDTLFQHSFGRGSHTNLL